MKIAVAGMGVAGLAMAAGFAELGHTVRCADIDTGVTAQLAEGNVPYVEPDLEDLVLRNLEAGRLIVGAGLETLLSESEIVFIAMEAAADAYGEMQLASLWSLADRLAPWPDPTGQAKIVAVTCAVPVGTSERLESRLRARLPAACRVEAVSVPEFLGEGTAVRDFFEQPRIVIGASSEEAFARLGSLYGRLEGAVVMTDRRSAELTKLAGSAYLAVKLSFAGELASLAEQTGADYPDVARLLGMDPRIAPFAPGAGLGFGGYGLTRDTRVLVRLAEDAGAPQTLASAALRSNALQPLRMVRKLEAALSDPARRKVALLGLASAPGTDGLNEAPSVRLAAELLRRHPGITLTAYDPVIGPAGRRSLPRQVRLCGSAEEALAGADAAVVVTDWPEFRGIRAEHFKKWMNRPIILDGRNALDCAALNAQGVICIGTGRLPAVPPDSNRLPDRTVAVRQP
ncbi:nucleotide sugar dehydrogenase [Cohnella sp. CFH 77786]|uniref:UDP-glucose dehydrogenase family protein n=1 Tax=Cohnella sp. CFH 77786 TaxID=2662265 RepID=UPI001C6085AD|nr:nucleotide sugar dehydrogenase [Cohnella sp. CFH 77786]MBW5448417.1 nucleotide sugar dehydrogenase [Cohnella sp. CFH 77786]